MMHLKISSITLRSIIELGVILAAAWAFVYLWKSTAM